ncbi:MAG: phosphoribosyltransferase family protein [Pyrinomonadaceae bacterium]
MLKELKNSLLSIIYPQECRVCFSQVENADDGISCIKCWEETRILDGGEMLCDKCGAFFGDKAAPVAVFCHKCDDHFYDKAAAAGIYENGLAATVIALKAEPVLPKRLRDLISKAVERNAFSCADLIVPIPLSKQRRLERGFNQAEVIAREISRSTKIPVDKASLSRKTHTPVHRVGMDKRARELTVQNAFEVLRPKLVTGKKILLVDDVLTSGATASYCAKTLKKNGATEVNIFTLARAVMS